MSGRGRQFRCRSTGGEKAVATDIRVIGSFVQAMMICPRQVWLMSRQICPDEDNVFLELGRLIGSHAYGRERKEIHLGHLCLDLVRRGGREFVVGEVKKSSRAREAARMQLAFYLYELREMGIEAEGELLFPEERRRERVVLDAGLVQQVEELKRRIIAVIYRDKPPPPQKIPFCSKCAYAELCWA
ncbi:CRISPR-associated protein Cas4 [Desulfofundulus kuznetsovii DSM 6115]|uniref:CRISPR-associated exonuclease Cas4 n=1 Tax=Desulfofundulus kuznetsovii (strain DSM 6115 / VKM B-1805 / 17) TaxID=760568 RepID=A0AAU8PNA7_DESK7|nr:CRISPR-associated protein Cas4 [Desulfofundulus kuznetsovii DSM 6115]